jgi:hypothetical protein
MIKWEIKKLFKNKSILISGIVLIILCSMMSFLNPDLETENNYIDNKGNYIVDNRAKDVIANEKLEKKVTELKSLEKVDESDKSDDFNNHMSNMAYDKLKKDSGKEYKDINFYKVFNYRLGNVFSGIVIVGIVIYIFSNIYTDEKLSNVDSIILSGKNKYKALFSKLSLSILVPIVIYLIYILAISVITAVQYGQPINGNLQAYRIVDVVMLLKPMTINEYTMINIITMMIIFVSVGVFASLFSFITNNSVESIMSIVVFVIIGKLISIINFLPQDILTVIRYSNYIDIIMNSQMFIGNYMGSINIFGQSMGIINLGYVGLMTVLIIGIVSNIYVFRKVLNK